MNVKSMEMNYKKKYQFNYKIKINKCNTKINKIFLFNRINSKVKRNNKTIIIIFEKNFRIDFYKLDFHVKG